VTQYRLRHRISEPVFFLDEARGFCAFVIVENIV